MRDALVAVVGRDPCGPAGRVQRRAPLAGPRARPHGRRGGARRDRVVPGRTAGPRLRAHLAAPARRGGGRRGGGRGVGRTAQRVVLPPPRPRPRALPRHAALPRCAACPLPAGPAVQRQPAAREGGAGEVLRVRRVRPGPPGRQARQGHLRGGRARARSGATTPASSWATTRSTTWRGRNVPAGPPCGSTGTEVGPSTPDPGCEERPDAVVTTLSDLPSCGAGWLLCRLAPTGNSISSAGEDHDAGVGPAAHGVRRARPGRRRPGGARTRRGAGAPARPPGRGPRRRGAHPWRGDRRSG